MKRKIGRPAGADSRETQAQILRAARACFGRYGYATTTNKMIADRAGFTPAAVYFHFGNKQGAFVAAYNEIQDEVDSRWRDAMEVSDTFRGKVKALLEASLQMMRDDPELAAFVAAIPVEVRREDDLDELRHNRRLLDVYNKVVEFGCATGEVRPADRFAVRGILSAMVDGLSQTAATTDFRRHQQIIEGFERLLDGELLEPVRSKGRGARRSATAARSTRSG